MATGLNVQKVRLMVKRAHYSGFGWGIGFASLMAAGAFHAFAEPNIANSSPLQYSPELVSLHSLLITSRNAAAVIGVMALICGWFFENSLKDIEM